MQLHFDHSQVFQPLFMFHSHGVHTTRFSTWRHYVTTTDASSRGYSAKHQLIFMRNKWRTENWNNRLLRYQGIQTIEVLLYLQKFSGIYYRDASYIERCNYENHTLLDLFKTRIRKYLWNISYKNNARSYERLLNAGVFVPKRTRDRVRMKITRPRNGVAPFIENFFQLRRI